MVKGASDAGIYVGQSNNIIVRDNRAEGNVAGIEIENSNNADVYGNTATGNTGGILVFNMPNLPVPGSKTRVYKNTVVANNHANFGAKGSAVSSVPPGSGVIVNSNDEVEIFDNDVKDNKTANVIISSYYSTGFDTSRGIAAAYDPFPENIYVTGNRFSGGGDDPGGRYRPDEGAGRRQAAGCAVGRLRQSQAEDAGHLRAEWRGEAAQCRRPGQVRQGADRHQRGLRARHAPAGDQAAGSDDEGQRQAILIGLT